MGKLFVIGALIIVAALWLYRQYSQQKTGAFNAEQAKTFLLENAKNVSVVTTDSGLQYERLIEGTGEISPTATDKVKVHYHGTLADGSVFDSSYDRGEPITFGLNQVIKGWTEGLQMMVVGEKAKLVIPPELGYGNRAAGSIPPGSVLVFDVELIEINP